LSNGGKGKQHANTPLNTKTGKNENEINKPKQKKLKTEISKP